MDDGLFRPGVPITANHCRKENAKDEMKNREKKRWWLRYCYIAGMDACNGCSGQGGDPLGWWSMSSSMKTSRKTFTEIANVKNGIKVEFWSTFGF